MVSAVSFAKDHRRVSNFYIQVFSARVTREDLEHADLACDGFRLVVQRIPDAIAKAVVLTDPPRRRENAALRLDFTIGDIARSRSDARSLGGAIDDQPPPWAAGVAFYLGYDPEGNVFGITSANDASKRT
jgi:predicted enzyme related to lactoylglutathione lyase